MIPFVHGLLVGALATGLCGTVGYAFVRFFRCV